MVETEKATKVTLDVLKGKTLQAYAFDPFLEPEGMTDLVKFTTADKEEYTLGVEEERDFFILLEDIEGDFDTILGSPITEIKSTSHIEDPTSDEKYLVTMITIVTEAGQVTMQWCGLIEAECNGEIPLRKTASGKSVDRAGDSPALFCFCCYITTPIDHRKVLTLFNKCL